MPTNTTPGGQPTGGTSEETSLTVKLLQEEWIVENGIGESLGSVRDREGAIALARQVAAHQHASSIAVLGEDGAIQETLKV
jgi:hypothetical protein